MKSEIASLVGNHCFSLDESQILSVCFWGRGRSVTESPSEMLSINKYLGDKMTQLNSVLVSSCSPKGPRNSRRRQSDVIDTTLRLARNPLISVGLARNPLISGVKQTVSSPFTTTIRHSPLRRHLKRKHNLEDKSPFTQSGSSVT